MSRTFPAVRAKMGSTTYYQASVSATELTQLAKVAKEMDEWRNWSSFERFQRELNIERVRTQIVPYLVRMRDRFFGAFIIVAYRSDEFSFEPLGDYPVPRGAAYQQSFAHMGSSR